MLSAHKRNTNIGVGLGLVLQYAGRELIRDNLPLLGVLAVALGLVAFIWGCGQYAKGKGYSAWFGAFGLLSVFGLIVLVLFPDKHKNAKGAA